MHGLINRAFQCFVQDIYGVAAWQAVIRGSDLPLADFEPMATYDDQVTDTVIATAADVLGRPRGTLLEDMGTYLVNHDNLISLRRLLRFSGVNFADFVNSIEELPDRARLALSDLDLPALTLTDHGKGCYTLSLAPPVPGLGHVMAGLVRAMADDYGALVLLDHMGLADGVEEISIRIADQSFNEARPFNLGLEVA